MACLVAADLGAAGALPGVVLAVFSHTRVALAIQAIRKGAVLGAGGALSWVALTVVAGGWLATEPQGMGIGVRFVIEHPVV